MGIAPGGISGQVLLKRSDVAFETRWGELPRAGLCGDDDAVISGNWHFQGAVRLSPQGDVRMYDGP